MKLTVTTPAGEVASFDVPSDMELENLIPLIQIDLPSVSSVAPNQLVLMKGPTVIDIESNKKANLDALGLANDDMLLLISKPAARTSSSNVAAGSAATGASGGSRAPKIDFSAIKVPKTDNGAASSSSKSAAPLTDEQVVQNEVERLKTLFQQPSLRGVLMQQNNDLFNALNSGDDEFVTRMVAENLKAKRAERQKQFRMATADPFDAEAQRMIEEHIREENIKDTLEHAIEHMPEHFARVYMLYVRCKVNGHEVKAFVDTGAQNSIMSLDCAKRCNLLRLVDKRFQGVAMGVGTTPIVGKIHMAQMQINNNYFPASFTILDDHKIGVMFGLDMLKRHQCVIDLNRNVMIIGTTGDETPFLSESELPTDEMPRSPGPPAAGDDDPTTVGQLP